MKSENKNPENNLPIRQKKSSEELTPFLNKSVRGNPLQKKDLNNPFFNKNGSENPFLSKSSSSQNDLVQKKEGNKTGLPDNLKSGIENLSGTDISDVNVHYNSDKPAQIQAHAFAQGTDIHVASGQEQHLPHEAWHVVQQKQGRVEPTLQTADGLSINDDKGLEKEADLMGGKALQGKFETTQLMEEEEEPLQGKFETTQLMEEEEEPLQAKFETTQLMEEEEEPLQGKFETTQVMEEEEEPLQGKFETTQLMEEEEEPIQGKFETTQLMEEIEEEEPK